MQMNSEWEGALKDEFSKDYFLNLMKKLEEEYAAAVVYPAREDIFNAFNYTPLSRVKAVIIGQDPYHEPMQAHGLSFSVKEGVKLPPSLVNIFKELGDEFGCSMPDNGNLEKWAEQGVFLLNSVLTVRAHEANSHKALGWEEFTDAVIRVLNEQDRPIVYMLWGSSAQKKGKLLDNEKQLVLKAAHPSPLSVYRGFWGCGHFKACNDFLIKNNISPIDWQI